jgi:pantoate--beta-alanine ligase
MKIIKSVKTLRPIIDQARLHKKRIGFVPTMGALHQGHATLLERCQKENDLTVLSIFVNPTQFGPTEDFQAYPRTFRQDVSVAKKAKVDIIFYPSVKEMYPSHSLTSIDLKKITKNLCGRFRPGHFQGVATVVAKLLNIVRPHTLYLGQKDAQQCVVIRQMVRDLNFPVEVKIVPTIREAGGLALSSRNKYLNAQQHRQAAALYESLLLAKKRIRQGTRKASVIIKLIKSYITQKTSGKIQYVECVDADSLQTLQTLRGKILIALAVWFGKARLIDNIIVQVK